MLNEHKESTYEFLFTITNATVSVRVPTSDFVHSVTFAATQVFIPK